MLESEHKGGRARETEDGYKEVGLALTPWKKQEDESLFLKHCSINEDKAIDQAQNIPAYPLSSLGLNRRDFTGSEKMPRKFVGAGLLLLVGKCIRKGRRSMIIKNNGG